MASVRVRLRIVGDVQGVGFRQFVRSRSEPLGVGGFVQNRTDGSVVAELEGEPEKVRELERVIRQEHPYARVEQVDREEVAVLGVEPPVRIR